MKLTIESTTKLVEIQVNGASVPARIWEGHTASGIPVHCFITRVAVHKDLDASQFENELQEHSPPTAEVDRSYPLRMIL